MSEPLVLLDMLRGKQSTLNCIELGALYESGQMSNSDSDFDESVGRLSPSEHRLLHEFLHVSSPSHVDGDKMQKDLLTSLAFVFRRQARQA